MAPETEATTGVGNNEDDGTCRPETFLSVGVTRTRAAEKKKVRDYGVFQ